MCVRTFELSGPVLVSHLRPVLSINDINVSLGGEECSGLRDLNTFDSLITGYPSSGDARREL